MDTVIQMVLDSNWSELTKYVEQKAASKILDKIGEKKKIIRDKLNAGFDK